MAASTQVIGTLELGADAASAPIEILATFAQGSMQATWSGVSVFVGTLNIQTSNDQIHWNDVKGGALVTAIMDSAADTQIFSLKRISEKYLRLKYTANGNTTGALNYIFIASEK